MFHLPILLRIFRANSIRNNVVAGYDDWRQRRIYSNW
jgi:hypothetical protein